MRNKFIPLSIFCLLIGFSNFLEAQEIDKSTVVTIESLERDYNKEEISKKRSIPKIDPESYFRHHKKLPATFEGYVIELTTSDFPLKRDYHLFEQFGKVYYDKVENEGYAYLIIVDFSSKKSIETYLNQVIKHKASEARIIEYKKGKRLKEK